MSKPQKILVIILAFLTTVVIPILILTSKKTGEKKDPCTDEMEIVDYGSSLNQHFGCRHVNHSIEVWPAGHDKALVKCICPHQTHSFSDLSCPK